jgi:hypothetical protein
MAKRPKRPRDPNQLGKLIVDPVDKIWRLEPLLYVGLGWKADHNARCASGRVAPNALV